MKKIVAGSIIASMLIVPAMAQDVSVYLNNERMIFDQNPIIENGRTLVPLRSIFEGLGAEVKWNPYIQEIRGITSDKEVILKVGETSATVNGNTVTLDVAAKIENGRTLVPLRFISESLEAEVKWNAEEYRIDIEKKKKVEVIDDKVLKAWEDIQNLDLIGDISEYDLDDKVTRAEMAKTICEIMGAKHTYDAMKNMPSSFKDVPTGEWYTGCINLIENRGIVDSKKENTFRPNEGIKFDDAIAWLVNLIGGEWLNEKGDWSNDYKKKAEKSGLLENIDNTEGELTYSNFAILISNAIDIPVWDITGTTANGELMYGPIETLRQLYFKKYL